jgi:hypothetical protein
VADLTPIREDTPFQDGLDVATADLQQILAAIDATAGFLADALGGPNFLPATKPVTVVPGSGMQVVAGGAGQKVIAQARLLDVCSATPLTVSPAGLSDRVDLIAIKATRVAGALTGTRQVRSPSAPSSFYTVAGTLSAGIATITLSPTFPSLPACFASALAAGSGVLTAVPSTTGGVTTVTVTSSNGADARQFNLFILGNPTGANGVATVLAMLENRPQWTYVQGTSTAVPTAPAGYDAFASILIHASETSILAADITYLFPTIPALSQAMTLNALTTLQTINALSTAASGNIALIATALIAARLAQSTGAGNYAALQLYDSAAGASATPSKFLRVNHTTGALELLANGLATLLSITDAGVATFLGSVNAPLFNGSGAGLTGIPASALPYPPVQSVSVGSSKVTILGTATNPVIDLPYAPVQSVAADEIDVHTTGGLNPTLSLKSGGLIRGDNFAATSGRTPSAATVVLPNDGKTYNVYCEWRVSCVGDTPDITAATGTGVTAFNHINGTGFSSGTLVAWACCTVASAAGQTVSFTLASGGGTSTSNGLVHAWSVRTA